jgi:hypothetical protein
MKTKFNVIRYDYSTALTLDNIAKATGQAMYEMNGSNEYVTETVATFTALPEAESFAREQAAAAPLYFSGNTAKWKIFSIEEVDQNGDFVDHHGDYGIDIPDIRRSLKERQTLECEAIDFAESYYSEEDHDGLTVIGDPFFHNNRWMMEVEGINGRRYIGLNAFGEVEFAEY